MAHTRKKNAPYLYDLVVTHALDWPSLTCQWFPDKEQCASYILSQKFTTLTRLLPLETPKNLTLRTDSSLGRTLLDRPKTTSKLPQYRSRNVVILLPGQTSSIELTTTMSAGRLAGITYHQPLAFKSYRRSTMTGKSTARDICLRTQISSQQRLSRVKSWFSIGQNIPVNLSGVGCANLISG